MSNYKQIITAGVGAVVGFFIGGPIGAFKGHQAGVMAGAECFDAGEEAHPQHENRLAGVAPDHT